MAGLCKKANENVHVNFFLFTFPFVRLLYHEIPQKIYGYTIKWGILHNAFKRQIVHKLMMNDLFFLKVNYPAINYFSIKITTIQMTELLPHNKQ